MVVLRKKKTWEVTTFNLPYAFYQVTAWHLVCYYQTAVWHTVCFLAGDSMTPSFVDYFLIWSSYEPCHVKNIRIAYMDQFDIMLAFMAQGISFLVDTLWCVPYVCSKDILWVHILCLYDAAITFIHSLCFCGQGRKIIYTSVNPTFFLPSLLIIVKGKIYDHSVMIKRLIRVLAGCQHLASMSLLTDMFYWLPLILLGSKAYSVFVL